MFRILASIVPPWSIAGSGMSDSPGSAARSSGHQEARGQEVAKFNLVGANLPIEPCAKLLAADKRRHVGRPNRPHDLMFLPQLLSKFCCTVTGRNQKAAKQMAAKNTHTQYGKG